MVVFVEIEARSRLKLASIDVIGSINVFIGRLTVSKILLAHFKNMCSVVGVLSFQLVFLVMKILRAQKHMRSLCAVTLQ